MCNLKPDSFKNDNLKALVTETQTPWEDTLKSKVVNALTGFDIDDIDFAKRVCKTIFTMGLYRNTTISPNSIMNKTRRRTIA
ncbi:MAG: hypothetical protein WKF59_14435 [Chitinophagaceae bacterium]